MEQKFFVDFVTVMLVNMAAGLATSGFYSFIALGKDEPRWAPSFLISGLVAVICGFYMIFKFPLPGPYNIAFGEGSVLLGMLFLGGSWAIAKQWSLGPIAIYAMLAGLVAVLLGVAFIHYGLSKAPLLAGVGFICTGLGGVLLGPTLWFKQLRFLRWPMGIVLLAGAAIWMLTAVGAYWMHMESYKNFMPY